MAEIWAFIAEGSPPTATASNPYSSLNLWLESRRIAAVASQYGLPRLRHLLTRSVGRPPNHVRRYYASFSYQAGSLNRKRHVVAKVEWHSGELVPRVGLDPLRGSSVTNLSRPAERVTRFYDGRGTEEPYIKEGKNAINWTRLSWHGFRNNEVRLQLHALAYNLVNFLRTLALPEAVKQWSLTTLRA